MQIIHAIILGLVQGLTEFLPVSSSGHLVFLQKLGIGTPSLYFNIMVHVGTLFAAGIVLFKAIIGYLKSLDKIILVLLSSVPTFLMAFLIKLFFGDALEGGGIILGIGFIVTAIVLVLTESIRGRIPDRDITKKHAFFVGIMQGLAVFPGVSRSGMTVGFLKGTGIDGKEAAEYSFIIGMPVILAGALYEILKLVTAKEAVVQVWTHTSVIFGMIAAFISGLIAIKLMLKLLARKSLIPFAAYVTILSILSFIFTK